MTNDEGTTNVECRMRNNRARGTSSFGIRSSFRHSSFVIAWLVVSTVSLVAQTRDVLELVLPTDNDALFSGGGSAFYQHIERNFKGQIGRASCRERVYSD